MVRFKEVRDTELLLQELVWERFKKWIDVSLSATNSRGDEVQVIPAEVFEQWFTWNKNTLGEKVSDAIEDLEIECISRTSIGPDELKKVRGGLFKFVTVEDAHAVMRLLLKENWGVVVRENPKVTLISLTRTFRSGIIGPRY